MNKTKKIINKWKGYYIEDCECAFCLYYGGKKQGCKLKKCCCKNEKQEAAANGRITRERGSMKWDM